MLNPVYSDDFLMHHGIKGMKWGVRRFQNPDGSLTSLGKKRLSQGVQKLGGKKKTLSQVSKEARDKLGLTSKQAGSAISKQDIDSLRRAESDWNNKVELLDSLEKELLIEKSDEVDAIMRKYGVDPDDKHRGYYEEDVLYEDKRYVKAMMDAEEAMDEIHRIEDRIVTSLVGEYASQPVSVSKSYSNDTTVKDVVKEALLYNFDDPLFNRKEG